MRAQRQNKKPETLLMPIPDSLLYPDRYNLSDVEDEEQEDTEYSKFALNLGAETPRTGSSSSLSLDEGYYDTKEAPTRGKLWRSSSFYDKHRRRDALPHEKEKWITGKDCGICFELAVSPARTDCCGKLFCTEHITDWLQGPSSDGRCPSCDAFSATIHTLPFSSTIKISTPPPSLVASRPRSRNDGSGSVPTITVQVPSRRSTMCSEEDASSSEEDSSVSSESSNSSWESPTTSLSHKPLSGVPAVSSPVSLPFFDVEVDSELTSKILSLVGLTLVLYVLVS